MYPVSERNSIKNCELLLQQSEVFQSPDDTVLVHTGGDVVGMVLHGLVGVSHGDANGGMAEHGEVIFAITKGHCFLQRNIKMAQNGVHTFVFSTAASHNINKVRVPAHGDEILYVSGEDILILFAQEGHHLIEGMGKGTLGMCKRRQGDGQLLWKNLSL